MDVARTTELVLQEQALPARVAPELDDDWYMRAYASSDLQDKSLVSVAGGVRGGVTPVRGALIALMAALGVAAGLGAAAHSASSSEDTQQMLTAEGGNKQHEGVAAARRSANDLEAAADARANTQELERIRTRNRRLEALVVALRNRQANSRSARTGK